MMNLLKELFNRKQTDFKALVQEGAVIIDVRTIGEYQGGHIRGSRNIPLDTIKGKLTEIKKLQKPVIMVCRSGARSGVAKSILEANGLVVYNGGAWDSLERKL
jgi:rhodanese-related sulfurtransferase